MIQIDGSENEGGGQILRTALGLSALTGEAFKIINIRANRPTPGLKEQHLQCVKAVKKLCSAEVEGAFLGSKELSFIPDKITKNQLRIKINTAGSIALVLQGLLIASVNNDLNVRIEGGGTWNKWAPSVLYFQNVLFPMLSKIGYNVNAEIVRNGFYPKGGALVNVRIRKGKIENFNFESGKLNVVRGISVASEDLRKAKVAARQADAAKRILGRNLMEDVSIKAEHVGADCTGSGILLWAEYDDYGLGFDVIGEKGKQSEKIGEEAATGLLRQILSKATVDEFMSDQILPFLALAEDNSRIKVCRLTEHAETNMNVIKRFLDVDFKINGKIIEVIK